MSNDDIAAAVLECVGGFANVINDSLCATRLRISVNEPGKIDRTALQSINGVLGIANRGGNGIEVVFGPNLVRGVFNAFQHLVGPRDVAPDHIDPATPKRQRSNFQVSITPETPGMPQGPKAITMMAPPHESSVDDDDTNALLDLLSDKDTQESSLEEEEVGPRLLVLNGPSINMLGMRVYDTLGSDDFSDLLTVCHQSAREAGFASCECYQSNHEGDLIDWIQGAFELYDALVINPGGYAYTSVALLDALRAIQMPTIEVHLSTFEEQDDFRRVSYVAKACLKSVVDQGIDGYRTAIFDLAEHLGIAPAALDED